MSSQVDVCPAVVKICKWGRSVSGYFSDIHIKIKVLPETLKQAGCCGFTICGTELNHLVPLPIFS
jgi:hypothetical protein